ncbi:MAG TPA: hypothetical protein PLL85_07205 [Gemmiger qucibialis]|nr:hypothetical protein [Gemmiger qucibialis]
MAKYFLFLFTVLYKDTFHIIPAQNAADDTSNNNNTFAALLQRGAARPTEKRQNKNPPVVRTGGQERKIEEGMFSIQRKSIKAVQALTLCYYNSTVFV